MQNIFLCTFNSTTPKVFAVYDYPKIPFMASLWIRLAIKGFLVVVQLYQVGARFEALAEGVLTVPSDLPCIFFTILTLLPERCAKMIGEKVAFS